MHSCRGRRNNIITLPETLHIDLNGTLFDYDAIEKCDVLVPYAREVTHLLSEKHTLIALTACTFDNIGNMIMQSNADILNEYFPWFHSVVRCKGAKHKHSGLEYLIDDTSVYFISGTHKGIYFRPYALEDEWPIRKDIKVCTSWLDIALYLEIV